ERTDLLISIDKLNIKVEDQNSQINQLQMEKSNLLEKIAEQDEEVIKLNTDLDQIKKVAKMMTKGTDAFEEMIQKQNYGKLKPIALNMKE
ncbi:hypothetical protein L195_g061041, partial [Trifolium pratense]